MSGDSSKSHGAVEVDVRDYVSWLFDFPLRKRIRSPKQTTCLNVARFLVGVAQHSQDRGISQLATDIWTLPLGRLPGKKATVEDCRKFLETYESYLGEERCKKALESIDKLADEQLMSLGEQKQPLELVEYRGAPMISYFARGGKRKWPPDDLSERVFEANSALREAGCPNSPKHLAQVMKEKGYGVQFTQQHIYSRLKFFSDRRPDTWPGSVWRQMYWTSLHPQSLDKSIPERQPFVFKWDG